MVATFGTDTMWVGWPWFVSNIEKLREEDYKTGLLQVATAERIVVRQKCSFVISTSKTFN